ncbi:MAG TPA: glycyl-radical enzyme activating protein [bacterium]|nr:glycyl-radical enzyme activating protein [bacterium]
MSEPSGLVFDIRRHAVHDGPGIRTTIFLKGCPLSCPWCHNPEGISFKPELQLRPERCIDCGLCREACPTGASADPGIACLECGACAKACPTGARELIGVPLDVDDVIRIAESDDMFFDSSDGGITFTGGEPLAQSAFVESATRALHEHGFRTAVDTSGYAPMESMLRVAAHTDLFLYDLKYISDDIHREICGVSNTTIHANIHTLASLGADVIISVPYIPGYNDSDDNMTATAGFVAALKPAGRSRPYPVRILPYHDAARAKYERRGQVYRCADACIPQTDRLEHTAALFRTYDIDTTIGGLS